MFEIETLIVLIPALPLLAAIVTALVGKRFLGPLAHWPAKIMIVAAFVLSLILFGRVYEESKSMMTAAVNADYLDVTSSAPNAKTGPAAPPARIGYERVVTLWNWATVNNAHDPVRLSPERSLEARSRTATSIPLEIGVTLRTDPLTALMLVTVTFVSSLVVIYSSGYMHGDPGYARFFTYISLFVFSMTMLVSSSNFVLLYVFWEAVGACSYLLIGYWFHKPEAAAAGKKAFLVNRVGDVGLALAIFLIWIHYGSLNFHDVIAADAPGVVQSQGVFGQTRLADPRGHIAGGQTVGFAIPLLLMLAACGKSAQFPLHVWLPDAMEGPTPVSALIHAATMVTAGVYLVTRSAPLFVAAPAALYTVAAIGGFTALLAGLIAVTQTDLKRVLAYSTVSQLGYMFLGLGTGSLGGMTAGMFHLFTHAFFKALLFLGAGSVMHAMGGIIDMRRFGGLRKVMPVTHWTFLVGALALAGVPPLAGFWSKDSILGAVHDAAHDPRSPAAMMYQQLYYLGLFTAFLTAFYTFRAYYMTFCGPKKIPQEAGHHAHESPAPMTLPLIILAVAACVVGGFFHHDFPLFLTATPSLAFAKLKLTANPEHFPAFHPQVAGISTLVALAGWGLAAYLYLGEARQLKWIAAILRPMQKLSSNKFYLDEIYGAVVVWPLRLLAKVSLWFDRWIIDGLVDLVGRVPAWFGGLLRWTGAGLVQFYGLAMVLGVLLLIGLLLALPNGF